MGFIEFPGGVVKKRESPDFRSSEVGISGIFRANCIDRMMQFHEVAIDALLNS